MADGFEQLKRDLKLKSPGCFYIFHGEEAYLRSVYLQRLKDQILDELTQDFNFHRFTAENLDPQALLDAVEALPMMAQRSMVQIDDVDFFAQNEDNRAKYTAIFAELPDYCTVVLVYETVSFKPDKRKKALAQALEQASVVEFTKPTERELIQWIGRHFKARQKAISVDLCQYLIQITGGLMTSLLPEIEKVASFAPGDTVTRADIDAVVEPVLEAVAFEISDAITQRRHEQALVKLRVLLQKQEEPIMILGAIGSQMRRLLTARRLQAAGKNARDLMSLCGIPSFPANKLMDAARRLSDRFCERAVLLCLAADEQLKTSYDDPDRILELLVLELAQEAARG